ncbi:hypothetical protein [Micromonospora sediminimaris]|uniref:Uncharacterized protein n=1 Tax=Micromonospora sediminimaris TaxID=547162 RepID=A0A9W5XMX9_9ACTN|nr:hypothetical protein [Micromonospora sediminimaris]GIJ36589.1 hypothetical protein Vse01_57370 [Micromonospora sediminimaris]SFD22820.1 hypothetical protein SAMN05216284_11368 [Micromonospora sediminimaris]
MTAQGVLLVTVVVWAVTLIRPVRWRALVAALPLPMTAALLATDHPVDGAQLVGVVGLNLFFGVVALAHHRFRWPILLADLAGVGGYLAIAAALRPVALPFWPTLAVTVACWLLAVLVLHRLPGPGHPTDPTDPAGSARLPVAARLLLVLAGAALTGLLGQVLRGLVVTFPYAGVLVAVEVRRDLPVFCRHFARNSLALIGFLVGVHLGQDVSVVVALVAGWAGFALVAAALHLPAWCRARRHPVNLGCPTRT